MQSTVKNPSQDSQSSISSQQVALYRRRKKIFVHYVGGFYQTLRLYTGWPLLLGYFLTPWLQWDNRQAVLFDLPARKFYVFGLTFWPQDFVLLAWVLIIAAFGLFFITSVVGRLWCGYTCPQTVWTAIFLWIEKRTEGSSSKRKRLERQPWNANKVMIKLTKHGLWLMVALVTGITFVAYFTPARSLVLSLVQFELKFWEWTWIVFFSAATYINAGWLREQVCIYMCPYARFQSAMIDNNTLIVSYDTQRGEPRGSRKRAAQRDSLGDCVDCQLCVQVCPTGIDIRDGLQIECIQCAHCIDACNQVMQKMDYPTGLIRYDSEQNMRNSGQTGIRFLRPRTLGYAGVLVLMMVLFVVKLSLRVPFSVDVLRERSALYHEEGEFIRNDYTLKIANKSQEEKRFSIDIRSDDVAPQVNNSGTFAVPAGEVQSQTLSLYLAKTQQKKMMQVIELSLCEVNGGACVETESRFFGPQVSVQ